MAKKKRTLNKILLNKKNIGYLLFITIIILLIIFVNRHNKNEAISPISDEIRQKRNIVNQYIRSRYSLDNDTILTDSDGYNFTYNENKYYLISVLDLMIYTLDNINNDRMDSFNFCIDTDSIHITMDRDSYIPNFKKNNEMYYLLFQIKNIKKTGDKIISIYSMEATGINFINENYFYEKAKH